MRGLIGLLCALALGLSAAPALAQSRVMDVQIPAPSLQGNLLGTPTVQAGSVYLPPSYGRGHKRYPVLYLLHGYTDTHAVWLNFVHIKAVMDRAIAAHRIPEAIVVMPDEVDVLGGGFYRNSPVGGRWEDFIADDVVHFADTHYRTLPGPGGRGLIGWSMGGYGAIHIAMARGGVFAAAYGVSPCCLAPVEDLGSGNGTARHLFDLHTQADVQAAIAANDYYTMAGIALLSAFSPDATAQPLHVRFPFKLSDEALVPNPPAYDDYVGQFAVNQIAQSRAVLLGLRAFGFDYGYGDQYAHIPVAARMFAERLSEARIPYRAEGYEGDHHDHVAQRLEAVVLPYIANALDAPR
ncbi:MAG: alpha/beta hydrolase-fold protein [Terricaulis sp.]